MAATRGGEPEIDDAPRVRYLKEGRVATVTLDRPEVLNAMDLRMHLELKEIWDDVARDDDIWLVVLSGAGDRAFSVGQDLKELAALNAAGTAPPSSFGSVGKPGHPRLTDRFDLDKPVLAKVQGLALGGGFELALACDLIIASDDSEFGLPEARLGLMPGAGGVFRLPRQIPVKVAMGHLLTGDRLSAARAYELGLVNEITSRGDLDEAVGRWTERLLSNAPLSLRSIKEAVARASHLPIEQAFTLTYPLEERRMNSDDAVEGPRAFREGREPRWTGQ